MQMKIILYQVNLNYNIHNFSYGFLICQFCRFPYHDCVGMGWCEFRMPCK
jgi:hypothetical protein